MSNLNLQQHLPNNQAFTKALLTWFNQHGRKNLPWQNPRTPYYVWLSEVMLQQTQVKTVIPYFLKFIARFPDIASLAKATEDEVLSYWAGLGYYSRGRNLQKAALVIATQFKHQFPSELEQLITLPGIGESTAAAIRSLAFNQPAAIMDGNVKRILSRYFLVSGNPTLNQTKKRLKAHADSCLPKARAADYTQAIMDLGALICTPKNPKCDKCPIFKHCLAYQNQVTDAYPEKAPKKKIPTREAQFLLMHNTKRTMIYLEKQPDKGLWGGLWSLPKLNKTDCAVTYVQKNHALNTQESMPMPILKHAFTHFKLHMYPTVLHVFPNNMNQMLPKNGRWIDISTLKNLGLPKPIQTILKQFLDTNTDGALPRATS